MLLVVVCWTLVIHPPSYRASPSSIAPSHQKRLVHFFFSHATTARTHAVPRPSFPSGRSSSQQKRLTRPRRVAIFSYRGSGR